MTLKEIQLKKESLREALERLSNPEYAEPYLMKERYNELLEEYSLMATINWEAIELLTEAYTSAFHFSEENGRCCETCRTAYSTKSIMEFQHKPDCYAGKIQTFLKKLSNSIESEKDTAVEKPLTFQEYVDSTALITTKVLKGTQIYTHIPEKDSEFTRTYLQLLSRTVDSSQHLVGCYGKNNGDIWSASKYEVLDKLYSSSLDRCKTAYENYLYGLKRSD